MTDHLDLPKDDQLELSLFGPGFGEAIALHYGNQQWLLVDSCKDSRTDQPASIKYLRQLGIPLDSGVKMILITHWHDDHVAGISEIVRACPSATIVASAAWRTDELTELMGYFRFHSYSGNSGIEEMREILDILEERKKRRVRLNVMNVAGENTILLRETMMIDGSPVSVDFSALSPSSNEVSYANLAFSKLIPVPGKREKRIATPKHNYTSVAMWCRIGTHRLLLGADVETRADPKTGWTNILDDSQVLDRDLAKKLLRTCPIFKVAHHGSKTGHDQRVWNEVLTGEPLVVMTPWNNAGQYLPTTEDLKRLSRLTPHAYITAPPARRRTKFKPSVVREILNDLTEDTHIVEPSVGHIRLRCDIKQPFVDWDIALFDSAIQ